MTIEGVDVSSFQATTPSLTGLGFLFARACYGTSIDTRYAMHSTNARAAGLTVGAYAFGVNAPVAPQVAVFLAAAAKADLFVLDLETESGKPRMTDDQARAFIAAVKATGRKCGLYHSESGFPDLGQSWSWVANWSQVPSRHWDFWQYHGGPLDLDRFNGTLAELHALAGTPPTTGVVMAGFQILPGPPVDITVRGGPGYAYYDFASGKLVPMTIAGMGTKRAIPIQMNDPIPGGAGGPKPIGWLVGSGAAFVLAGDANFTPDPVTDCSAIQAELVTAQSALTLANSRILRMKAETATFAADVAAQ